MIHVGWLQDSTDAVVAKLNILYQNMGLLAPPKDIHIL